MAAMSLREISDRIEIDDLLTRYATAVDSRDWDLYATCFTPDAFIDYTSAGGIKGTVQEVRDWLAKVLLVFSMTQHVVANRVVVIRGDTATARSCFYNPMGVPDGNGSMTLFIDGGYYNDRLVRTAEGWRIRERIEESVYSTRKHRLMQV